MLSLYLHIPWCVRKCPYCDFNSHAGEPLEQQYVNALKRDLDYALSQRSAWPELGTIFIGGGTPSLFSAQAIDEILEHTRRQLGHADNIEITLEANPGTAEADNFKGYRLAGVNRLSIGAQSFNNVHLQTLGRIHQQQEIESAFQLAREAGFDNINLDLMHSLPQQSHAEALEDLQRAIALQPEHLSWYELTLEPNTAFAQNPPQLPDNDTQADIEHAGLELLRQAGYSRYEISAFCKPERQCRHNLNYWRFGDYLGIGAGAHAKLTDTQGVRRQGRLRSPARYMKAAGSAAALASDTRPSPAELISEFALNCFRIDDAFTKKRFKHSTGLNWSILEPNITEAERLELVEREPEGLKKTPLGQHHLNRLLECFAE